MRETAERDARNNVVPVQNNLRKQIDLNGINPFFILVGATFPALLSVLCWQFTVYAGEHFAVDLTRNDLYFVRRAAGIARQVVVGGSALGTGIFGVNALGLVLLSGRIAFGIVTRELDPSKALLDDRVNVSEKTP
jgi:hypothetical protein